MLSHKVNLIEQIKFYKNRIDFLQINIKHENKSSNDLSSSSNNEYKKNDLIQKIESCNEGKKIFC